jgi:hypothetical protein
MEGTNVTKEELSKIKELIENIRFGTVTVVVQDGKIIQLERHEKLRISRS